LIISLLFFKESHAAGAAEKDIPNIFILVLSGVRNSESISDPTHQYIPNLWGKMRKEGVFYTDLVCVDQEFHMPAVNAINTGQNQSIYFKIDAPSIFQYVRKKYALPQNKLWAIKEFCDCGNYYKTDGYAEDSAPSALPLDLRTSPEIEAIFTKQELSFANSFRGSSKNTGLRVNIWDSIDEVFYRLVKKVTLEFKPKMLEFAMGGIDSAHYDTFARYVLSLKRSDEMVFEIWQMIQNDSFYKDNTYLIVCPDHSRNTYYQHHTQNAHDEPSHTWMYIYGPRIKKGTLIRRPIFHRDIFATLAYIMDVETLPNKGRVLKDCFLR
jgi:hypothetical protein